MIEEEIRKAFEELAKRDDYICISHFGYNKNNQFVSWTEIKFTEKTEKKEIRDVE